MNKDRIVGSAKQARGTLKIVAGKALGDSKLKVEGAADKAEGKIQNAVGAIKDSFKR